MHGKRVAWLVLLALLTGNVAATDEDVPPPPPPPLRTMDYRNVRAIAFTICRADAMCARRFFIAKSTFDARTFRYLFDRHVIETRSRDFLERNFASDAVKQAWLYTMRQASFCTENETVERAGDGDGDARYYCVCKNGYVCHEESPASFSLDVVSFTVVFVVALVATVYVTTVHLSYLRTIHDNLRRLRKRYELERLAAPSAAACAGDAPAYDAQAHGGESRAQCAPHISLSLSRADASRETRQAHRIKHT